MNYERPTACKSQWVFYFRRYFGRIFLIEGQALLFRLDLGQSMVNSFFLQLALGVGLQRRLFFDFHLQNDCTRLALLLLLGS